MSEFIPDAELTLVLEGGEGGHNGSVANNLTTTEAGFVLDARQGKVLADMIRKSENGFSGISATVANHTTKIAQHDAAITSINKILANKTEITVSQIVLAADAWVDNAQAVKVTGLSDAAKKVDVSAAPVSLNAYAAAKARCVSSSGDKLTFECLHVPKENLYVNICVYV